MLDAELKSFIQKFKQLRGAGLTAHLDLDTHAGQAWVGLRVMLNPVKIETNEKPYKYRSPSYFRRQERRKAARTQSAAERSQFLDDAAKVQETKNNTNAAKATVVESSKVDENSKQSELPTTEEVVTCFRCETCNFRSEAIEMRRKGNTNNLAQKILNIEQIDGNITPSSSMLDSSSCIEKESEIDEDQSEHEECVESENEDKEIENEETDDYQSEDEETENDQNKDTILDIDTKWWDVETRKMIMEDERVTDKTLQDYLSLSLKHPASYDSRTNCVRRYVSDIALLDLLCRKTKTKESVIRERRKWAALVKSKWKDYYLSIPILESHTEEMRKMEGIIDNFERWNRNENGKTTK